MALVQKYLGSLPSREPISDKLFADKRQVKRPVGPLSVTKTVPSQTNQAVVLDGFFGPDQSNLRDSRLMQIAARALSTRMTKVIREEKQLVYSIGASFQPGRALPGYGVFQAAAPTDPAKADQLGPALEALYNDFAKNGPTEEELATIRKQFANLMDEQMKDTTFWMSRLSELAYRNQNIKDNPRPARVLSERHRRRSPRGLRQVLQARKHHAVGDHPREGPGQRRCEAG